MLRQLKRLTIFLLGVFLIAIGVALSVRADLGTAPIASLPAVLSFITPVSVGTYVMTLNVIFVVLQVLILRRKFPTFQLIQLPLAVAFGLFVDLAMYLTAWLEPASYLEQWAWLLASVVLLAVGVYVEMQPRLTYLPGNAIVFTIYTVLQNIRYGTIKTLVDSTLVIVAAIVSLMSMGGLYGVREGTIFSALTVGLLLRWIHALHQRFRGPEPETSSGS
ncbi:YitT family protein [Enteractinococcus fodinae]|uniref:Membrane protein YczE n=1 Tax=Enteractinococcus fodinae TaxID=684663 RepID=A0ABU2AYZ6_9MICC|nr:DUF6198 family protein [Enteractinococcus fodinae]MDR7346391.1 putative membrane protein YczE [Enteractinococcus fodinae]